jgi:hypothetical protein
MIYSLCELCASAVKYLPMNHKPETNFAALFIWLGVQILFLWMGAARVPFSAHPARPGEIISVQLVLVGQLAGASLLFPYLMRDWRSGLIVIVTGWPMALLAGFLAGAEENKTAMAELYVTAWLAGLLVWQFVLRSEKSQLIGAAVASAAALGGVVLWYLRAEFAPGNSWSHPEMLGPIMGALAVFEGGGIWAWVWPGVVLGVGGVWLGWREGRVESRK